MGKNIYTEKYHNALDTEDISTIQEIISELNGLPPASKKEMQSFYSEIGDNLFDRNINIPNYNIDVYNEKIKEHELGLVASDVNASNENTIVNDFNDIFINFYNETCDILSNLKGHFILSLDNNSSEPTEIVILTDENYFQNPLILRIKDRLHNHDIQVYTISQFSTKCATDALESINHKYLCLLALSPSLNFDSNISLDLNTLIKSYFPESYHIEISKSSEICTTDYKLKEYSAELLNSIESLCRKVFNNSDINFEEEQIIKKFFGDSEAIIDYKILKAGFSGSKVIEVRPIRKSVYSGRFVIKYSKLDGVNKLEKEKDAFKLYIDEAENTYKAEYIATAQYEAIKYTYASADSIKNSESLSHFIETFFQEKRSIVEVQINIEKLFKCRLFNAWKGNQTIKRTIESIYAEYINESKLLSTLCTLEDLASKDMIQSNLWKNFKKIQKHELSINFKACHGDLHSENIFIDDGGVYLIDFGFTGERHGVIDHSTLECSLKFKHIPYYIPVEELISIERRLLTIESFNDNFDLSFIKREKIRQLYNTIIDIRKDAMNYIKDKSSPLEYLMSLYIMTLRQVNYKDLNQRFAYECAHLLGNEIISIIK